jgi:hypothetical protein
MSAIGKRSEVRGSKEGGSFEIFAKENVRRAFGNCLLWTSPAPVPDAVTLCTSEPLPRLLMQLKKKESDEGDEVKGLESKWAEKTWRNYYRQFFLPSAMARFV